MFGAPEIWEMRCGSQHSIYCTGINLHFQKMLRPSLFSNSINFIEQQYLFFFNKLI